MSTPKKPDLRKLPRYVTDVKVNFVLPFEIRAEVDFGMEQGGKEGHVHKYVGFSRNISAQGLCFESNVEVPPGTALWLELHLPDTEKIIYMHGEVRWTQLVTVTPQTPKAFLTGVQIRIVDGIEVEQTVYFDQKYHVMWSELLEHVLGGFAKAHKKKA